jgi:hypothetical protein
MADIEEKTAELITKTNCGAIALVIFSQNKATRRIGCLTTPILHDRIDENLRDFLAVNFPRVEKRVLNISVFKDT